MLENKILSNQNVSDSKRDAVINQSNQNSTDRKFEDAMYESRQQQLNTEQRQNAARNDHAQQQRRQQQEQVKSRQGAERSAESSRQTKNAKADDNPRINNDVKKKSSDQVNNKGVEKGDVESSSAESSLSEKNSVDNTVENNMSDKSASEINNSEPTTSNLEDETSKTSDTGVDNISWLDTFMKIIAHNEQNNNSSKENPEQGNQDTVAQASADSIVEKVTDVTKVSDVLTNFLFGADASTDDEIATDVDKKSPKIQDGESDIQVSDPTSLLTDTVIKQADKGIELVNDDITNSDGEGAEEQDVVSSLSNKVDKPSSNDEPENVLANTLNDKSDTLIKSDVFNPLGTEVKENSDFSDEDATQKDTPIFVSSALQQKVVQEQSIDTSKQPNLVEQSTKASTVLNFVNPALSELSKRQNTDGIESNQFITDLENELDGIKNNADGSNTSERKLDSELRSILDIKNASLLTHGIDGNTKAAESVNKTDVVDINGVQLDKTLQLPKLEHASQAKNEVMLRENILFNKQEMANHMQQQIGIMMSKNMKSIDIRLDPPELGAMQIKLTMNNDQAAVSFVVSNQQAKDALEASLPKLKELLEQQGMDLAESDVQHGNAQGDTGSQDDSNESSNNNGMSNNDGQDDANMIAQEQLNRAINSPWNVDYYA